MNSFVVLAGVVVWFALGYRFYGRWVEKNLVKPDDSVPTPAHVHKDGLDYSPARLGLLWGHHFSSIAGAGPIIGPIVAVAWFGWGAAMLWIALGCVLVGAVHDYLTLMLSVRHEGKGISEVAGNTLGQVTRISFGVLVWITLVFIIAVFAVGAAKALAHMPELVIPTFGVCAVAVMLGIAVYRFRVNMVFSSIVAIVLAYVLIWIGVHYPVELEGWSANSKRLLFIHLLYAYCLVASLLPVWLLLQPRDFISSVKLFVGLALGFIGIIVARPEFTAPAFVPSPDKPVWPIMFITLACGAVSGFHCLVGTGTSSKQLNQESDGKIIGFGGMIMEGVLAAMVVVVVGAGLKWGLAPEGKPVSEYFASSLAQGWIVAFSNGFGRIVGGANLPFVTAGLAALLGGVMVKTFVMTTLDTATRLGRFIFMETLFPNTPVLKNSAVATMATLLPAYYLAVSGNWQSIWRMFGSCNQLIAAVGLLVASAWLAQRSRPVWVTIGPALFMVATALGALAWGLFHKGGYLTTEGYDLVLGIISIVLMVLGIVVSWAALVSLLGKRHEDEPSGADFDIAA